MPKTLTAEPETKPKSVEDRALELSEENPHAKVFVLLKSAGKPQHDDKGNLKIEGRVEGMNENSRIIGIGATYEEMWTHAGGLLEMDKTDMRKHGYVFDHVTAKAALDHLS